MIVNITAADIAQGVPRSESQCPIAQSVRRQTGQPVMVDEDGVVYAEFFTLRPVGWAAGMFADEFDRGYAMTSTAIPYRAVSA